MVYEQNQILNNSKVNKTVNLMNSLGAKSIPFLFGFDFELENSFLIENPIKQQNVLFRTPNASNYNNSEKQNCSIAKENFIDKNKYCKGFNIVMDAIERGDTYLCNYTIKTPINIKFSLKELFTNSKSPFGICYYDKFISFSPERFVKIENGIISSNPMKGTIDANLPNAKHLLLNDYKEDCEHNTIVDLIRNDIGQIASDVNVKRFKYIDQINTNNGNILQMSSEIEGKLNSDYLSHLGDIIISILPAGSISGAPKESTIQIIKKSEKQKRKYYTGVFGYFDGTNLDSAVLIRFIEKQGKKLYYRSGGGITINSICDLEYEEAAKKIYLPI